MKNKKILILFIISVILIVVIGYFAIKIVKQKKSNEISDEYVPQEEISDEQSRETIVSLYFTDKETGLLRLDRVLYTSTHYPANYGFIPRTYAGDGDPLDVLVICHEEIVPLTLVETYPIGVLKMIDGGEEDEKIIAIPVNDPYLNNYKNITELPTQLLDEIMHFFEVYKQLERKQTSVDKMLGRDEAEAIVEKCINNYKEKFER